MLALSVVIAALDRDRELHCCLDSFLGGAREAIESLRRDGAEGSIEILVVGPGVEPMWLTQLRGSSSLEAGVGCRWIQADKALTPELWASGMREAAGEYVATTTSHFVANLEYFHCLFAAQGRGVSAVGGTLVLPAEAGPEMTAVFWLRYSRFSAATSATTIVEGVTELAADNACYRRSVLSEHRSLWWDGFWEPDLHRELRQRGLSLEFDPRLRLTAVGAFGRWQFCRQRVVHGYHFGRSRARQLPAPRIVFVLLYPLLLPLIPLLLVNRVVVRVRKQEQIAATLRQPLLLGLYLLLFACCWALGEVCGVVDGGLRDRA